MFHLCKDSLKGFTDEKLIFSDTLVVEFSTGATQVQITCKKTAVLLCVMYNCRSSPSVQRYQCHTFLCRHKIWSWGHVYWASPSPHLSLSQTPPQQTNYPGPPSPTLVTHIECVYSISHFHSLPLSLSPSLSDTQILYTQVNP